MNDVPPILKVEDLAGLLGLTLRGVRSLLRRGEIPAAKVGHRFVVRRTCLLAYLERQERAQRAPAPVESDAARLLRALPLPRRRRASPPAP